MGVALAKLLAAGHDDGPDGEGTEAAMGTVAADTEDVARVLTDLAEIAQTVHIVVDVDGSVVVEGIPASVPEDLREVVARIAADAAVRHIERTLRVRPTPSRDDKRLFTRAAREALITEASGAGTGTSKYDALTTFLDADGRPEVHLTFETIAQIVPGGLPASAYKHAPWWSNKATGRHVQAKVWTAAGWRTSHLDLARQEVTSTHQA